MPAYLKITVSGILAMLCAAAAAQPHAHSTESRGASLKQHYDAAQSFQKAGDLDRAGAEYRAFLADALSDLAAGHANAGEYARAASINDEALELDPGSRALRLACAKTTLLAGDFPRAQALAEALLKDSSADFRTMAEAHQIRGRALLKMNQDQDARKELEAAVALDSSFENGYDLAVACLDLDDEKCATQLFGEMKASFGDTAALHMSFGRAYGNSDFAPRAVTEFEKAIAQDPRFPGAHYSLAAALLATGQDAKTVLTAEAELKKELAISPRDFLTYAALGKIAATHQHYPEAESYLKRAESLNPTNPDAFLYLGQMEYDNGRLADAEAQLRQAIRLTTDASRNRYQIQKAHFLLGRILVQQHREEEARAEMQTARAFANKALSKDKSELAGLLPNLSDAPEPQRTSGGPAAAAQSNPPGPDSGSETRNAYEKQLTEAIADSYNNLGVIAAIGNDYPNALHDFERAGAWNPSLDGLDYNLGRAAFMASRFADAIPSLSRYVHEHPLDSGIRTALAISQFRESSYSDCIETLKGLGESIDSIPQVQYIYADSLVKTGHLSEGEERLESLVAVHPEVADVHRGLGEALALQGDTQRAIKEMQSAIQLNTDDPQAHFDLGKIRLEGGDAGAAIPDLEIAARLSPSDPGFHRELASAYQQASRAADADKELQIYEKLQAQQAPQRPASDPGDEKIP
jgi:tetratricopeptide (TPR) repeat protein